MYAAAVLLPLVGAIVAGLFGPWLKDRDAQLVTCLCMAASAVIGIAIFYQVAIQGQPRTVELYTWITSGLFDATWAARFDTLSAVMVMTVNVVSTMIDRKSVV